MLLNENDYAAALIVKREWTKGCCSVILVSLSYYNSLFIFQLNFIFIFSDFLFILVQVSGILLCVYLNKVPNFYFSFSVDNNVRCENCFLCICGKFCVQMTSLIQNAAVQSQSFFVFRSFYWRLLL